MDNGPNQEDCQKLIDTFKTFVLELERAVMSEATSADNQSSAQAAFSIIRRVERVYDAVLVANQNLYTDSQWQELHEWVPRIQIAFQAATERIANVVIARLSASEPKN